MRAPGRAALILRNGTVLALAVAASNRLVLPEGLFLALGMLTVLEADLGGGLLAGRERIIGTLLGLLAVVIGAGIFASLSGALGVFVGLTLVRLFAFTAGLGSGFVVGGHVVAGSLMHHGADWWFYGFWRTVMTILGVLLGTLVSRQIYSQRTASAWQRACDGWLLDLARSLGSLEGIPEPEQHFASLRERRNGLRRQLPQLAAEQSLVHGQSNDAVLLAQQQLQHGSTVMSSARDLCLLLQEGASMALVPPGLIPQLLNCGRTRMEDLVQGHPSPGTTGELRRCHALLRKALEEQLRTAPATDPPTAEARNQLLFASRLLLLPEALIRLPRSPHRRSPQASR